MSSPSGDNAKYSDVFYTFEAESRPGQIAYYFVDPRQYSVALIDGLGGLVAIRDHTNKFGGKKGKKGNLVGL